MRVRHVGLCWCGCGFWSWGWASAVWRLGFCFFCPRTLGYDIKIIVDWSNCWHNIQENENSADNGRACPQREKTVKRHSRHSVAASPQSHSEVDTTRSQFSIEIEMAEDASKPDYCGRPPSELLGAVRTLHDLIFRLRYRTDVFLHSLSLFKKIIRVSKCPLSSLLLSTCVYLSSKILQTRQVTPAELVSCSMYAFTRDQLMKTEEDIVNMLEFDVCCSFAERLEYHLKRELTEMGIRIGEDEWPVMSFQIA